MDASKMKNMIVIRNLPSNIVDEAFIILKSNKKNKVLNKIEKEQDNSNMGKTKGKDYIIKEAELVVNNYLSKVESSNRKKKNDIKELEKKYKRLKIITAILAILIIVEGIIEILNS